MRDRAALVPKAVRITDGVWAIASRDESELSQVCVGKYPKTIKIIPPLSTLRVPLGCGVYGDTITLPPYYQTEEKLTEGGKSFAEAKIPRGIFQGDAQSPLLFIIAIMQLRQHTQKMHSPIQI